jgi:hypothetical protein
MMRSASPGFKTRKSTSTTACSADQPDIEGGSSIIVGQFLDGQNLVSHLLDGIAALFMVSSSMSCPPMDSDDQITDTFAPGLDRAIRHGWLKDQDQRGSTGQRLDQCPGG